MTQVVHEGITQDQLKALIRLYVHGEDGLLRFTQRFLKNYCTCETPPFHAEIYRLLTTEKRLAMAAPRSFGKSTLCAVFFPIYCALFRLKKDIVIISASETLSVEWLRKIKMEFSSNAALLELYYRIFNKLPESEKWSSDHIILSNGVSISAKGAEAQLRGLRPSLVILDDCENDEAVRSEERRKFLREWFFKALINTLGTSEQAVLIGTVLSSTSLLSHLLENGERLGWTSRKFQAYKNGVQEAGRELWPSKWPHAALQARKKEIGSHAFASEFMNDPVSSEASPFKEEYIRYYEGEVPPSSYIMALDPAYSENETADYKVVVVIAKDVEGRRFVVDYIRTHAPQADYLDGIMNLYKRYRPQRVGIPCGGTEKAFYQTVTERFYRNQLFPELCELKSVTKKESRIISALQGLFQAGQYYISRNHHELRDEILTFPFAKNDDLLDALAYGEQIIQAVAPPNMWKDDPVNRQCEEMMEEQLEERGGTCGYGDGY